MTEPAAAADYDLVYFQYALHQLDDAPSVLRAAWAVAAPGRPAARARLAAAVRADEFRTRHGELIAGVQLDELYQGTALATRDQFLAWFDAARRCPGPTLLRPPVGRLGSFEARRTPTRP